MQFWSNLLGFLIGFHWVPSIHASTNMIPTSFAGRCRRSLSVEHFRCMHLQGASFCHAAWNGCGTSSGKMTIFLTSAVLAHVDTVLLLLKCCSSLIFFTLRQVIRFRFPSRYGRIFFDDSGLTSSHASTPLSGALQGQETEASGPWAFHRPGFV